jgi:hypothetical protein
MLFLLLFVLRLPYPISLFLSITLRNVGKGTILVALGRYGDTLMAIDQALHLDPSNVDAYYD